MSYVIDTSVVVERAISKLVKEGNNFIKITPLKEFNTDLLRITLE